LKPNYRRASKSMRILALILCMLLLLASCVPIICSAQDSKECIESFPTDSIEEQQTESTIRKEQPLKVPELPKFEHISELKTVYDVQKSIDDCVAFLENVHILIRVTDKNTADYAQLIVLQNRVVSYKSTCDSLLAEHWKTREAELPVMTYIWNYLTAHEFNDYVAAGLIGNMIAEAGGCGYGDINIYADNGGHYGICQWSKRFYPKVNGQDLDFQLQYLRDTYEQVFESYGYLYSSRYGGKFRTEQFLALEDPAAAAVAFGLCYERPGGSVTVRGKYANMAYEYFTVLDSWPWYGSRP